MAVISPAAQFDANSLTNMSLEQRRRQLDLMFPKQRLIPSQKRGKYYLIEESDMKKRKTGKGRKC